MRFVQASLERSVARHMGGYGEAVADASPAGMLENLMIARRELDELGELRPSEAYAGEMARPMDRIGRPEPRLVEIVDPVRRVIVEPDHRPRVRLIATALTLPVPTVAQNFAQSAIKRERFARRSPRW